MLCSEIKDMDKYGDNGIIQKGIKVLDKNIVSENCSSFVKN